MTLNKEYDEDETDPDMQVFPVDDIYDLRELSNHSVEDSENDNDSGYCGEVYETNDQHSQIECHRDTMRRQNVFFGISLFNIAVASIVVAFFLMGMSFTRSGIGLFGNEVATSGRSGEVGIDASNSEVQELIDKDRGEYGNIDDSNEHHGDLLINRNKIGPDSWAEKKQWWATNNYHLNATDMSMPGTNEHDGWATGKAGKALGKSGKFLLGKAGKSSLGKAGKSEFGKASKSTFGKASKSELGKASKAEFGKASKSELGKAGKADFGKAGKAAGKAMRLLASSADARIQA